jgi:hypothetical protein
LIREFPGLSMGGFCDVSDEGGACRTDESVEDYIDGRRRGKCGRERPVFGVSRRDGEVGTVVALDCKQEPPMVEIEVAVAKG